MPLVRVTSAKGFGRGSPFLLLLGLVEPRQDEFRQRLDRRLSVGPLRFEFQYRPTFGCQHRQIKDALPIHDLATMTDPDVRRELRGKPNELVGRSEVQPQRVRDLHLLTNVMLGFLTHGRLDSVGQKEVGHRAGWQDLSENNGKRWVGSETFPDPKGVPANQSPANPGKR